MCGNGALCSKEGGEDGRVVNFGLSLTEILARISLFFSFLPLAGS